MRGLLRALVGASMLLVPGQPALAAHVSVPVGPVTKEEELAGDLFDAGVRMTVPRGGRLEQDNFSGQPPSHLWTGPRFSAGGQRCRVTLELHAWAYEARPRHGDERHTFRRGGVTFHSSDSQLDDTRAISGSAWFRLPEDVAAGDPHRYVSVLAAARRGQDHCLRPIRRRARPIVRRALRSLAFVRRG